MSISVASSNTSKEGPYGGEKIIDRMQILPAGQSNGLCRLENARDTEEVPSVLLMHDQTNLVKNSSSAKTTGSEDAPTCWEVKSKTLCRSENSPVRVKVEQVKESVAGARIRGSFAINKLQPVSIFTLLHQDDKNLCLSHPRRPLAGRSAGDETPTSLEKRP